MKFRPPASGHVVAAIRAVAVFVDGLLDFLPATWAAKIRSARKAIAGGAGAAVTALTTLTVVPLPDNVAPWVTLAFAVATALATYVVPNGGS